MDRGMSPPNQALAHEFLAFSRAKLLEEYWPRLRTCVAALTDEQIWWSPNDASNSVGNLLLHLNGNVRQWLITSFNVADDRRDRPAEFAASGSIPVATLLQQLDTTLQEAEAVLAGLGEADLLRRMDIQGYTVTGTHAVYHVVEHFSMHYGQIVYITKLLTGANLGFYGELDATGKKPRDSFQR